VKPAEISDIAVDREVFRVLHGLLPAILPTRKAVTETNQGNLYYIRTDVVAYDLS